MLPFIWWKRFVTGTKSRSSHRWQRPRCRLSVEELENRLLMSANPLADLSGSSSASGMAVPPFPFASFPQAVVELNAASVPPSAVPPFPLVQFNPQAILTDLMSAGSQTNSTGLLVNGDGSANLSESVTTSQAGSSGPAQDHLLLNYQYRLDGVAEETVTPGSPAAPGSVTISFSLSGRVEGSFQDTTGSLPPQWIGRLDALMTIHGSLSGTWTKDASLGITLIDLNSTFTTDTAIHQNESITRGAILIPWFMDATVHSTGTGDATLLPAGIAGGAETSVISNTGSATDDVSANVKHSQAAGTSELLEWDISFHKIEIEPNNGKSEFMDDWNADDGTGSGTSTPSGGQSSQVSVVFAAAGSSLQHVIPTVVLAAPVALAPSNTIFTTTPTFSWTAVPGATNYFVTIIDLTTPLVVHGDVAGTSLTLGFGLTPGDTYVWYVQALDNQGDASDFSNSLEFAVAFGSS